jgi:hypothetical protein
MARIVGATLSMDRVRRSIRKHVEEILGMSSESVEIEVLRHLLDRPGDQRALEKAP